jgi:hypothetical protein
MDIGTVLVILILALDFVLSIWNSYASGYNFKMLRRHNTDASTFMLIYCVLGLMIGVVGTIYVLAIVIGVVAFYMNYISFGVVDLLLAYNFIIFGGLITLLGVGITIQSWVIAIKTHNKWMIVASLWNTFASIWNVFNYISEFSAVTGIIKSESKDSDSTGIVVVIFIVAIIIAVLLSYVAFHAGSAKADNEDGISKERSWLR